MSALGLKAQLHGNERFGKRKKIEIPKREEKASRAQKKKDNRRKTAGKILRQKGVQSACQKRRAEEENAGFSENARALHDAFPVSRKKKERREDDRRRNGGGTGQKKLTCAASL